MNYRKFDPCSRCRGKSHVTTVRTTYPIPHEALASLLTVFGTSCSKTSFIDAVRIFFDLTRDDAIRVIDEAVQSGAISVYTRNRLGCLSLEYRYRPERVLPEIWTVMYCMKARDYRHHKTNVPHSKKHTRKSKPNTKGE